mgnify:FL=1
MIKIIRLTLFLLFYLSLSACAIFNTSKNNHNGSAQWDFDHNVQFRQTQLASKHFQLEIIPNNKVKFKQLATFLLRKSYSLCGGYYYKLEMIQGIEGFDDKRAMPNYIHPSLMANIECKVEVESELKSDKL